MKQLFLKKIAKQRSVQEWLPIEDINKGFLYRKDEYIVTALKVNPVNISLLSDSEINTIIAEMAKILNAFTYDMQWLSLCKPVELDSYMLYLEEQERKSEAVMQKKLLKSYMNQAVDLTLGAGAISKDYYILLQFVNKDGIEYFAKNVTTHLCDKLSEIRLYAEICDDQKLIELLFTFNHPIQSSFESCPQKHKLFITPLLRGE